MYPFRRHDLLLSAGTSSLDFRANGLIQLWEADSWECRFTFEEHRGDIKSIALADCEQWFVSAGDDGFLYLWDPFAGTLIRRIEAHEGPVECVAISQDDQLIASVGWDGRVRIWSAADGQVIASLRVGYPLTRVIWLHPTRCVVAGDHPPMTLDLATPREAHGPQNAGIDGM